LRAQVVYAEGNAHIEGDLTWKAKTGYASVSAAAFQPILNTTDYTNYGYELIVWGHGSFVASVQLPHGARITGVAFYWYDSYATEDGECILYRLPPGYAPETMVNLSTTGSSGAGSTVETNINNDLIDNLAYTYYLEWTLYTDTSTNSYING
jgi:hypothetical protein